MMSPEGAVSPNQVPGPQQVEVVGQPSTLVKVSVPTGAVPGQQINFTMPNGQRVSTTVQEQVQPGALLTVSVPSPAPTPAPVVSTTAAATMQPGLAQAREALLPQPVVVNALEADRQQSQCGWIAFGLSFIACCVCGAPIAMCIWGAVALNYFCKPREERNRHPRSFAPACASAVTAGVLCCCALLGGLGFLFVFALCGPFDGHHMDKMDSCPGLERWINATHMDHHHHWHPKWLSSNDMGHGHHWHPHWLHGRFHGHHDVQPFQNVVPPLAVPDMPADLEGPVPQHHDAPLPPVFSAPAMPPALEDPGMMAAVGIPEAVPADEAAGTEPSFVPATATTASEPAVPPLFF